MASRQIIRRKNSSLRRNPGQVRHSLGSEVEAIALWRDYKLRPVHPYLILDDEIVDGNRRHWGAELAGDLEAEVECLIFEGEPTRANIALAQFSCALHRADISLYDKIIFFVDLRAANPGRTLRELAGMVHLDPSMPTKLLSFEECIPEVQDQVKSGAVGLTEMIEIAKLPRDKQAEQIGKSRSEIRANRQQEETAEFAETAKGDNLKIILASQKSVVIKAKGITLSDALSILNDAIDAIKAAKKVGYSLRTFERMTAEKARGGKAKEAVAAQ